MPLRHLYGGAMSIDIPERFEDISQFRQVPDHQEAFADSNTDSSIIIELNQMEKSISNEKAAEHHLNDLNIANDATEINLLLSEPQSNFNLIQSLQPHVTNLSYCCSESSIAKYRDVAKNRVQTHLFCLRMPEFTTDLLLSLNVPTKINQQSSTASAHIESSNAQQNKQLLQQVISTLRIHDVSLFR